MPTPASSPTAAPTPSPTQVPTPPPTPEPDPVPLVVATGFSNYRLNAISSASLRLRVAAGSVIIPCGIEGVLGATLGASPPPDQRCTPVDRIHVALGKSPTRTALLPAALVSPDVKVVPLDGVDLFGEAPQRSKPSTLVVPNVAGWPDAWIYYDPGEVRVLLTTGVNCADRGVSHQTNVLGRGWEWLLNAGTAKYTGQHWDTRYGWYVVDAARTGHLGAVKALIRNADVAVSDFECPMTSSYTQHDEGTTFTVDPAVATLMKEAGFDVATIASDHMTNAGLNGLLQTVRLFDKAGIRHVGGGTNLAAALKPAVVTVRGLRFGFVGLNGAGGSVPATTSSAGTAPLTASTIRTSIAAARKVADVVIVLPQWSTVEYQAGFTAQQLAWRDEMFAAGADHIVGADFHWAGGVSITPDVRVTATGVAASHLTVASQGNFWFGQDWSRQTQEGVMTMSTFVGTRLAQVRFIPTVVLNDAQPNLTDPATDGQFVLKQVLGASVVRGR